MDASLSTDTSQKTRLTEGAATRAGALILSEISSYERIVRSSPANNASPELTIGETSASIGYKIQDGKRDLKISTATTESAASENLKISGNVTTHKGTFPEFKGVFEAQNKDTGATSRLDYSYRETSDDNDSIAKTKLTRPDGRSLELIKECMPKSTNEMQCYLAITEDEKVVATGSQLLRSDFEAGVRTSNTQLFSADKKPLGYLFERELTFDTAINDMYQASLTYQTGGDSK